MNDHIKRIQAHATAVHTRHRTAYEESFDLRALPGTEVVTIRKPWKPGKRGTVLGVFHNGPDLWLRVMFADGERRIPASAVARRPEGPDCATAEIQHVVAFIKMKSGEYLD